MGEIYKVSDLISENLSYVNKMTKMPFLQISSRKRDAVFCVITIYFSKKTIIK